MKEVSGNLQAQIDYHWAKIRDIEQDFVEFNKEVRKFYETKSDQLKDYALHVEGLVDLGQIDIPINGIANYIFKRLNELHLEISRSWFYETLDSRFKRAYNFVDEFNELSTGILDLKQKKSPGETIRQLYESPLPDNCVIQTPPVLPELGDLDKCDNKKLSELRERAAEYKKHARAKAIQATDVLDIIDKKCDERGLKVRENDYDPQKTLKGDRKLTSASEALANHIKTLQKYYEKLVEFPPPPDISEQIAQGINAWDALWTASNDDKWTKCMPDWFKVQVENYVYGKHAAAVRNGNKDTYAILFDAKNLVHFKVPVAERPLTREQVGDSQAVIDETAHVLLSKGIPIIMAVILHHRMLMEPNRSHRKTGLAPRLSDQA